MAKKKTGKKPTKKAAAKKKASPKKAAPEKAGKKSSPAGAARALLIKAGMAYPGAYEDHPWGELVLKVHKKVFVFFGVGSDPLGMSVKLPHSSMEALMFPFAKPTGYGLGKAGWVSLSFDPSESPPVPMLLAWLDESYRAVAPKKLVDSLGR